MTVASLLVMVWSGMAGMPLRCTTFYRRFGSWSSKALRTQNLAGVAVVRSQ